MITSRSEKQEQIVENGINNLKSRFYIAAATGFGKSRMCVMTIQKLLKTKKDLKVNIVVPTADLLNQWQTLIDKNKLNQYCRLYIVNTYIKQTRYCNLLIADECHVYVSETAKYFNKLLEVTEVIEIDELLTCYVSATLTDEHMDFLHRNNIQCAGVVTREEALENGWCANYSSYVLMLDLNEQDQLEHKALVKKLKTAFSLFSGVKNPFPLLIKGVSDKEFRKQISLNRNIEETKVFVTCNEALKANRRKQELLENCDTKEKAVLELTEMFPFKGLIFGQSTAFSDRICLEINRKYNKEVCVSIHSKKKKTKKFNENQEAIRKLTDNRYNIKWASTAKKLEIGIDIPDVKMLFNVSYTRKRLTNEQKWGRALRLDKRKDKAILVSLCIKGSVEESKLLENGTLQESIIVYSVDEILQCENRIEKELL